MFYITSVFPQVNINKTSGDFQPYSAAGLFVPGDGDNKSGPKRKVRRKVNVEPGKSVTASDMNEPAAGSSKTGKKPTKQQKILHTSKQKELKTKFVSYASFAVPVLVEDSIKEDVINLLMSGDCWPEGVLIRKFFYQCNGSKQQ